MLLRSHYSSIRHPSRPWFKTEQALTQSIRGTGTDENRDISSPDPAFNTTGNILRPGTSQEHGKFWVCVSTADGGASTKLRNVSALMKLGFARGEGSERELIDEGTMALAESPKIDPKRFPIPKDEIGTKQVKKTLKQMAFGQIAAGREFRVLERQSLEKEYFEKKILPSPTGFHKIEMPNNQKAESYRSPDPSYLHTLLI